MLWKKRQINTTHDIIFVWQNILYVWPNKFGKSGKETDALVSSIDISATVLELAGIDNQESIQGRSFMDLLDNPEENFRNVVFAEHNWHDYEAHERMVRNRNFMYILNSRPELPQLGPADAVSSPTHQDLDSLNRLGLLNNMQSEYLMLPRPKHELFDLREDPEQWNNIAQNGNYHSELLKMQAILEEWKAKTADNIPNNLTKDWYELLPHYIKTPNHSIRGEMPGTALGASKNNNPGPF